MARGPMGWMRATMGARVTGSGKARGPLGSLKDLMGVKVDGCSLMRGLRGPSRILREGESVEEGVCGGLRPASVFPLLDCGLAGVGGLRSVVE